MIGLNLQETEEFLRLLISFGASKAREQRQPVREEKELFEAETGELVDKNDMLAEGFRRAA